VRQARISCSYFFSMSKQFLLSQILGCGVEIVEVLLLIDAEK
jgi:hypothetical protein